MAHVLLAGMAHLQELDRSRRAALLCALARPPGPHGAVSGTTAALLARGGTAGAHVGNLCTEIHRREGETGVRAILGVLALARRHGPVSVDQACAEALRRGRTTYRFVRDLLRTARPGSS